MDFLKFLGVVIGATLLALGLGKVVPLATGIGFVLMFLSMFLVALTPRLPDANRRQATRS